MFTQLTVKFFTLIMECLTKGAIFYFLWNMIGFHQYFNLHELPFVACFGSAIIIRVLFGAPWTVTFH